MPFTGHGGSSPPSDTVAGPGVDPRVPLYSHFPADISYAPRVRTRLAPTPSGFVHEGNLVNFLVIARLAATFDAAVALRIDDIDHARVRDAYVEDIFRVLACLGIRWNNGPRSSDEMPQWSQRERIHRYRQAYQELWAAGLAYHCTCSRTQWDSFTGDSCPSDCRHRNVAFEPNRTATRVHLDDLPDPIIWRRDDLPAYHLTSVVDDHDGLINLVVRGEDLESATNVQRFISKALPGNTFHEALVVHHPLVTSKGRKLSKSAGARSSPLPCSEDVRVAVSEVAAKYSAFAQAVLRRNFED